MRDVREPNNCIGWDPKRRNGDVPESTRETVRSLSDVQIALNTSWPLTQAGIRHPSGQLLPFDIFLDDDEECHTPTKHLKVALEWLNRRIPGQDLAATAPPSTGVSSGQTDSQPPMVPSPGSQLTEELSISNTQPSPTANQSPTEQRSTHLRSSQAGPVASSTPQPTTGPTQFWQPSQAVRDAIMRQQQSVPQKREADSQDPDEGPSTRKRVHGMDRDTGTDSPIPSDHNEGIFDDPSPELTEVVGHESPVPEGSSARNQLSRDTEGRRSLGKSRMRQGQPNSNVDNSSSTSQARDVASRSNPTIGASASRQQTQTAVGSSNSQSLEDASSSGQVAQTGVRSSTRDSLDLRMATATRSESVPLRGSVPIRGPIWLNESSSHNGQETSGDAVGATNEAPFDGYQGRRSQHAAQNGPSRQSGGIVSQTGSARRPGRTVPQTRQSRHPGRTDTQDTEDTEDTQIHVSVQTDRPPQSTGFINQSQPRSQDPSTRPANEQTDRRDAGTLVGTGLVDNQITSRPPGQHPIPEIVVQPGQTLFVTTTVMGGEVRYSSTVLVRGRNVPPVSSQQTDTPAGQPVSSEEAETPSGRILPSEETKSSDGHA